MIPRLLVALCLFGSACSQRNVIGSSELKAPGVLPTPQLDCLTYEKPYCGEMGGIATLSESERADCVALGGYIDLIIFNTEGCVIPRRDGGKICRSSDDCEGACLADLDLAEGTPTTGTCAHESGMIFGCYNYVEQGKAGGPICF